MRKILCSLLVATLMLGFTNSFVQAEETENEMEQMEQVKHEHKAVRPHFNFYYQLLAEKYAPNYVKLWGEITSEREAIVKKYRELVKSGKDTEQFYDETWLKAHSELQQKFLAAVEKRDEKALKELVPQIIDQQKELNVILKNRLKEMK